MYPVGFHRYIIDNFDGEVIGGPSEREVKEFDPPSEVSSLKNRNLFPVSHMRP